MGLTAGNRPEHDPDMPSSRQVHGTLDYQIVSMEISAGAAVSHRALPT